MSEYQTDGEYIAAKQEITNALDALDLMLFENAVAYLQLRSSLLNDEQVQMFTIPALMKLGKDDR